ncbi:MAG: response regulator transcription factor [Sphingorhabdus sp.]|jgi:DNA-binding response OmpR family regulator|uniref:response regulator transcription factor n=1 Tax=Sphingorhabdus sp. TaxID=1902408 RepID=UPI0025D284FB|nr:response regulator transcription factor [Sphingorhabdus sp.]MCO4091614.1 response regulator transcription factor [Sphingorhabdus sp.]
MKVFIADYGVDVVDYLKQIVEDLGYVAVGCTDKNSFTEILSREVFDLVILDWNVRAGDNMSLLAWMNKSLSTRPPVIMMAKRSAKRDITEALHAGAEDYITKPESRNVIAARINALLRGNAAGGAFDTEVIYGAYKMDRLEQSVTIHGQTVVLTAKEFELAEMFFKNTDRTLSRHYIMQTIWRTTASLATRTLDMHISRVRAKLALRPENGFRISTVFGYGYRLESAH